MMTVPRHISNSSIAQAVAVDALYDQALAFVQTNQDASCTGLQMHFKIGYGLALQLQQRLESHGALVGIESPIEPHKVIVRIVEQTNSPDHAVLELLASDNLGYQRLAATSPPMPEHAAKRIAGLYDKAHNITPTFASLKAVLASTGAMAWASATSSASNAAMAASVQACRSLKTQGVPLDAVNNVLVITAMTPECRFIDVIRTVFSTVRSHLHPQARMATAIIIDEEQAEPVRVQLLVTGLPTL